MEQEILNIYSEKKESIMNRLEDFKNIWKNSSEQGIFVELVFCILTPQSKAKICWAAVEKLVESKILFDGDKDGIAKYLKGVRFKSNKSGYITNARLIFSENGEISVRSKIRTDNIFSTREWLVKNVKGIGYKEASHFLRNVGFGEDLAILDRHILKNLKLCGVIDEIPASLSKKKYLDIEDMMKRFSEKIAIPMSHLDFVLWCKETGEIFK